MKRMIDDSNEKMDRILEKAASAASAATVAQQDLIKTLLAKPTGGSGGEHSGGGNGGNGGTRKEPPIFKGEEKKYSEWMVKLIAYFKSNVPRSEKWINISMNSKEVLIDEEYDSGTAWNEFNLGDKSDENLDAIKKFSTNLYVALLGYTEDEAFKIVQSVSHCQGLEALRLLKRRYDPRSPGTKRALLKSILGMPPAKKLTDIEPSVMRLEEMVKKYESMTGSLHPILPNDLIVTIMIDLCTKELREHMELTTKDENIIQVRTEIFNYVERKRANVNEQFVNIEVDNVNMMKSINELWSQEEYGEQWYDSQYEPAEELHYFGGKGGGAKGQYGKGSSKSFQWDAKGKGKSAPKGGSFWNKGGFGDGKGGKGKGKDGKGGFQGDCYWCGKFGHSQRDCADKDAYMSWVRKGKGKGAEQDVNNIQGDCEHKPEYSLTAMENSNPNKHHQLCGSLERQMPGKSFRPLNSLVSINPWTLLARDTDEIYDTIAPNDQDVPPGLNHCNNVPKAKMPRVKKWQPKSGVKDSSKPCCWSHDQGGAATWHRLHADGFKSSGMCRKEDGEFTGPGQDIELSSIEEFYDLFNIEKNGFTGTESDGDFIDFTVDSGAADTVANKDVAPNVKVVPSYGSRNGVKYVAAAGKVICNEGEKNVRTETAEGHLCGIKIQVAQVNKALLSVSKICDVGHEVLFTKDGGKIVHNETGQVVQFRRVDGVYRLRVKIVREVGSGFARPGM